MWNRQAKIKKVYHFLSCMVFFNQYAPHILEKWWLSEEGKSCREHSKWKFRNHQIISWVMGRRYLFLKQNLPKVFLPYLYVHNGRFIFLYCLKFTRKKNRNTDRPILLIITSAKCKLSEIFISVNRSTEEKKFVFVK